MKAISIKNVDKIYGFNDKRVTALKNINCDFEFGKFYLIIGHSGSGKSTLLRILGLIDRPTKGDVFVSGKYANRLNSKELAHLRNNEIGFIFQDYFLDKYLTAKENITIPMLINKKYKNKQQINQKSLDLLKDIGLEKRVNHFPKELSGGEQQRVAIARALANNPNIILADEPTGNLDIENETYIFNKLKEMSKKGKCIIVVSHSKDAIKYADKVIELKEGILQ